MYQQYYNSFRNSCRRTWARFDWTVLCINVDFFLGRFSLTAGAVVAAIYSFLSIMAGLTIGVYQYHHKITPTPITVATFFVSFQLFFGTVFVLVSIMKNIRCVVVWWMKASLVFISFHAVCGVYIARFNALHPNIINYIIFAYYFVDAFLIVIFWIYMFNFCRLFDYLLLDTSEEVFEQDLREHLDISFVARDDVNGGERDVHERQHGSMSDDVRGKDDLIAESQKASTSQKPESSKGAESQKEEEDSQSEDEKGENENPAAE